MPTCIIRLIIPIAIKICFCSTAFAQLGVNKSIVKLSLTRTEHEELRSFLAKYDTTKLQDTIFIKYDFNHETCWSRLDQQPDDYVKKVLEAQQDRIKKKLSSNRPISVFEFREKGKDVNKLKKWNQHIIIDSSRLLYKVLFKQKDTCGSSAIILPDRRVIIIRSDGHFEALDYKKEDIEATLAM